MTTVAEAIRRPQAKDKFHSWSDGPVEVLGVTECGPEFLVGDGYFGTERGWSAWRSATGAGGTLTCPHGLAAYGPLAPRVGGAL